jgi:hypothetical protein
VVSSFPYSVSMEGDIGVDITLAIALPLISLHVPCSASLLGGELQALGGGDLVISGSGLLVL